MSTMFLLSRGCFTLNSASTQLLISYYSHLRRGMTMTERICPVDGTPMYRGERPLALTYKDKSITFDMPGWYCPECGEGIHTSEDMKISDRMLNRLKARSEGLLEQEEIRRIRKKLH